MKLIGNLIWFIPYGLFFTLLHILLGIVCCLSVIFIPFGIQHFKLARYAFAPFGKAAFINFVYKPKMNTAWLVFWLFSGWVIPVLVHIAVGTVLCFTIVGIPFAKKCFKLATLTLVPFGAEII